MTNFLFIRHGLIPTLGSIIAGRAPGIHLTDEGREQAARLAFRLTELPIRAIYCSPLERTREMAAPLSERLGLPIQFLPELLEVDFGDWTGRRFEEVLSLPEWRKWKSFRSGARVPGGESMCEVQTRVIGCLDRLRERHPEETVAVVSHGDVVRAALIFYLGIPLDLLWRIEISPASVSILSIREKGPVVLALNSTERLPAL